MSKKHVSSSTILFSFVLVSVLASIGLILFEGMDVGILFFVGYLIVAAVSSIFKDKRYFSRRALGWAILNADQTNIIFSIGLFYLQVSK